MASRVFLASALGGGIGALVALHLIPPFWWLGLIVGGLVGYLSYEFKNVILAARGAWILAVSPRGRATLREFVVDTTVVFPSWLSILLPLLLLLRVGERDRGPCLWFEISINLFSVWVALVMVRFLEMIPDDTLPGHVRVERARYNIFTVWGYYLPLGLWWLAKRLPRVGSGMVVVGGVMGRFPKRFFLLIHSEARLLCAFDAAMGALIGYSYENILVGALSGGIIGLINFEIISKRVLHMVPAHKS